MPPILSACPAGLFLLPLTAERGSEEYLLSVTAVTETLSPRRLWFSGGWLLPQPLWQHGAPQRVMLSWTRSLSPAFATGLFHKGAWQQTPLAMIAENQSPRSHDYQSSAPHLRSPSDDRGQRLHQ